MKLLALNISVTEMINSLEGLNSRFKPTGEIVSKLKNRLIEIMQSEEQRERKVKKINTLSEKYEPVLSTPTYNNVNTRSRGERGKRKKMKK